MKINIIKSLVPFKFYRFKWCTLIALCFIFKLGKSQIPSHTDIENFALFTNSGAFTNTGNTNIIGDIGTQVGAFTGFPPGVFIGQAHIADTTSVRIAPLVTSLYTYFLNLTADTTIAVGLGNSQVLPAKIYNIGAAATLDGNLTLDGQGDPNAIFIFKIDGALNASKLSNVSLINSASICNVYWQVNGLFSMADSSVFRGTLLANGHLTLNYGSVLEGRALSIGGAIIIDNVLADITCLSSTLPVTLTNFSASCEALNINISWSTASEISNDHFVLYRSHNGKSWESAVEKKGAGNSMVQKNYQFIDNLSFADFTYYRLKQVDYNGAYEYSAIIWIKSCSMNNSLITVYPNPTAGIINIDPLENKTSSYALSIYSSTGNMVYFSKNYKKSIDLRKLENGCYSVIINIDGTDTVQEIVISK